MDLIATAPKTAWASGRFRGHARAGKLLFGRMYEDVAIELQAFQTPGRIFCIASAGCTAIALTRLHRVVAVDSNPVQLAYVERRLTGSRLEHGSAERILAVARTLAALAGWKREIIRVFLDLDNPKEQLVYWQRHLNTQRFRVGFDFLLARKTLRSIYSASLLDALPANSGAVLRGRMERCFALHSNRTNPYARALLLGEDQLAQKIVDSAQIELVCADAADFLESQPTESFTGFSLSNILDGANGPYQQRLLAAVQHAAAPDAIVVLRSFREPNGSTPTNPACQDRSMLWGIVDVRPAATLSFATGRQPSPASI